MDFEFTLKFKIDAQTDEQFDEIVERLGAEGCTDALVGTVRAHEVLTAIEDTDRPELEDPERPGAPVA